VRSAARDGNLLVPRAHSRLDPVEIVEQTDRFELTSEEVERWKRRHPYWPVPSHRHAANGKLRLATAGRYGSGRRSNFTEGPRGALEGTVNSSRVGAAPGQRDEPSGTTSLGHLRYGTT
jgi:hypothetical protein